MQNKPTPLRFEELIKFDFSTLKKNKPKTLEESQSSFPCLIWFISSNNNLKVKSIHKNKNNIYTVTFDKNEPKKISKENYLSNVYFVKDISQYDDIESCLSYKEYKELKRRYFLRR